MAGALDVASKAFEGAGMSEEKTTEAKKFPLWKRWLTALGGVVGVVAILTLLQAFTDFTIDDLWAGNSQPTETSANQSPPTQELESPSPSPSSTATTSAPRVSPTSPPPTTLSAIPSDALSSIVVVSEMTTTTYGKVVGREDNLYQMANGWGHIQVAYGWSGLRADGTEIKSDNCRIVVAIEGPQSIPAQRYGQCTNLETDFYKADDNKLKITAPGEYKVTVKDEKSGVSGTGIFTILSE